MDKEISVIIPVYNAEAYLERCVESIVYGEFKDIEVILVEDCSKDESWKLCQILAERFSNVKCYQNEKNSGVSYTRNHGLKKANGKYVVFVDSDDWGSGRYIKLLYSEAKSNQENLVICGLHFIDKVAGYRREYLWDDNGEERILVEKEQFFDLVNKFLLQQLWNKIFRRDIIENNKILFDEAQSMGEDFQFVLDYMEAAKIEKCIIINEPLYYYIRYNNNSLMSQFGLVENDNEYKRFEKLKNLCGEVDACIENKYQIALQNIKNTYVYQMCRNTEKSNIEKKIFIESIMQDGKASEYLKEQNKLIVKEQVVQFVKKCKRLPERVKGKFQREKNEFVAKQIKKRLRVEEFSIISQNCIGGVFYHDMKKEFLSPTINLFFKGSDFIRFVQNLKYYLDFEVEMFWDEEYPIGVLEDIKIYFMHYNTCSEAKEMWEKRKKRIVWDKIIILATDMEDFEQNTYQEWSKISYPKVLFTAVPYKGNNIVYYPEYERNGKVEDLIPMRKFYRDNVILDVVNSVVDN